MKQHVPLSPETIELLKGLMPPQDVVDEMIEILRREIPWPPCEIKIEEIRSEKSND